MAKEDFILVWVIYRPTSLHSLVRLAFVHKAFWGIAWNVSILSWGYKKEAVHIQFFFSNFSHSRYATS